jgi:hypothetical protein
LGLTVIDDLPSLFIQTIVSGLFGKPATAFIQSEMHAMHEWRTKKSSRINTQNEGFLKHTG